MEERAQRRHTWWRHKWPSSVAGGCHAGMLPPRASVQASMAAFVPNPVSLMLGVACPCTASLPHTARSVHLSTFSETCLDGAKSSLSLKAATGLVCECVWSWAASLSCPPLFGVLIQQEDKSGAGAPTCFCPCCSSASVALTSFRSLSNPGRLQPLGLYTGCSLCPG